MLHSTVWDGGIELIFALSTGVSSRDSHHSAAGRTCSSLPALWMWWTCPRPAGPPLLGLSHSVSSCSPNPADGHSSSSAGTEEQKKQQKTQLFLQVWSIVARTLDESQTWTTVFSPWCLSTPCCGGPAGDRWRRVWRWRPVRLWPQPLDAEFHPLQTEHRLVHQGANQRGMRAGQRTKWRTNQRMDQGIKYGTNQWWSRRSQRTN